MPRLIITEGAAEGLERCRRFLNEKNPRASANAARTIARHLRILEKEPAVGRPDPVDPETDPETRELIIPFGDSGYVALYRLDPRRDAVVVLAFRHQKEAGYRQ